MTLQTPWPGAPAARAPALVLAFLVALLSFTAPPNVAAQTVTYEYVYPYNTPDLIENHYIVLDMSGPEPRGWYYGTSDEFDSGREGYLPGFFVAPMSDLEMSAGAISFGLSRPERFFASPVRLEYRSAEAVPTGLLGEWAISLPSASRRYGGGLTREAVTLDVPGGPRVFQRMR
jgi:hypothetical protein